MDATYRSRQKLAFTASMRKGYPSMGGMEGLKREEMTT